MDTKTVRKFGIVDKLAYMCGDVANDFSFIFVAMYLLVFYTKVLGISGAMVGTLFLTARFVDAFTDVGMGRIIDTMTPRAEGRFRFWIKVVSPFVCLSSFLLFVHVVKDFSYTVKIIYIFVTYILWGSICYTGVNIPYGSMASVISEKAEDRAALSVFRSCGAAISIVVISYIVPKFIYVEQMINGEMATVIVPERFTIIAAVFSVVAFIFYVLCYKFSIERVQIANVESTEKKTLSQAMGEIAHSLGKNRALQIFIALAIILLLTTMLGQGLLPYVYTDYFNDKSVLAYAGMIGAIMTFALSTVAVPIARKIGKQVSGAISLAMAGIVFLILMILKLHDATTFFVIFVISTIGSSFFNIIIWAFIADIIDDQEVREGKREDGTVYAVYSFARKVGQALAGGLTGFALSAIGYSSSAAVQTEAVKNHIYNLYTGASAAGYIICALILMFVFPLSQKRVDANTKELMRRRGEID